VEVNGEYEDQQRISKKKESSDITNRNETKSIIGRVGARVLDTEKRCVRGHAALAPENDSQGEM